MKQSFHFLTPLLIAAGIMTSLVGHAHAADYTQTRLMDDQIFNNSSSLTQTQISSFLNGQPGSYTQLSVASPCLSNYQNINFHWDGTAWHYGSDSDWNTSWGPTQIPAASIITQAAQLWGINPEVIIATLEKEESLVTGSSCDPWRYNSAMGYGCPDSGGCNARYVGFSKQVLWGSYQLEFGLQRSYGSTSWDDDGGLTYSGYMTAGNRARCASCTVNYYDGYAPIDGQSILIENGATAALYSYTPHLGNSTPVNFERWFGPSVLPNYAAAYAGQSPYATIIIGNSATAYLKYSNVGNTPWYDNTSVGSAPAGSKAVHLATTEPINRSSALGSTWGGSQNRPTGNFSAVYLSDGVTLAPNQHIVQQGQIAMFSFTLSAPNSLAPGIYRDHFQPIAEGSSSGAFNDPGTFLDTTVQPQIYSSAYAGESGYPSLSLGQQTTSYFSYKNTGNMAWYDDASIGSAPAGIRPAHLATSHEINRSSAFGATWGGDNNRPSGSFAAVYEADGATLAGNQHMAQPGQIAKFSFTLAAPNTVAAGTYREFFQPIIEGVTTMNDTSTFLDVTLLPYSYGSAYYQEAAYPTISRGSSTNVYFMYKNIGTAPWYDLASAPRGIHPVVLATSHPINRISNFGDSSWCNPIDRNRPTCQFAAVYEGDGTTLAANQHVAQPGQIAKVGFSLTASSTSATGIYREFFQLITEGVTTMNDTSTFLDIAVTP